VPAGIDQSGNPDAFVQDVRDPRAFEALHLQSAHLDLDVSYKHVHYDVKAAHMVPIPRMVLLDLLLDTAPLSRAERIHALFPLAPVPHPTESQDLMRSVPVLADTYEAALILPRKVDMRRRLPTKEAVIRGTWVCVIEQRP
jgi:hypothetical protein